MCTVNSFNLSRRVFFVIFPFFVHFVLFVAKPFVCFVAATLVAASPRWE